jgi:hypothetical protein
VPGNAALNVVKILDVDHLVIAISHQSDPTMMSEIISPPPKRKFDGTDTYRTYLHM